MTFAQRRNRLTTHLSECIPVVKRRISVFLCLQWRLCFSPDHEIIDKTDCYHRNAVSCPVIWRANSMDVLLVHPFFMEIRDVTSPTPIPVKGVGLQPLACWDCGFESSWRHGCLSVVNVVCCQVQFSARGWSLARRSPALCGVSWVWSGATVTLCTYNE